MTKQHRAERLRKKRKNLFDLKTALHEARGPGSNRLEIKLQKLKIQKDGSTFMAVASRRDDTEVRGALASLAGQPLDELKKKYKKFVTAG